MVAITAALVGSTSPQAVQVSVSGLSSGDAYEVVGVWSGGTWPVRGGVGTSNGSSLLVLNDLAAPVNIPLTYRVTSGVDVVDSAAVTVAYSRSSLLASLDGRVVVTFAGEDPVLARAPGMRQAVFDIPGRPDPVVIYDRPTSLSGDLNVVTDPENTRAMDALLNLGGLAAFRSDGQAGDLPASTYMLIMGAPSSRLGAYRQWSLSYRLLADPEPGTVPAVSTWDDVKTSYAGLTYADVKAEWAGQTWADFRTYDWQSRASA